MKYELIVIGGGSAGHAAARIAAGLGLKCALVEAPGTLGGLCILRGCMPSKILIETANRMREVREGSRFGIDVEPPKLNIEKLRERLAELTKDFRDYRQKEMKEANYDLIRGNASFTSANEISVKGETEETQRLQSSAFIIATGSTPEIPDIPGLKGTPFWTSDDVVKLPDLPKHIAIVGSGAIGMEAAHLYEGLGSKVSVLARGSRILSQFDADVADALEAESKERGIEILKDTHIDSVNYSDGQFRLNLNGENRLLEVDALMIAAGRSPNTKGLNLEKIGIAMRDKLILIDNRCVTSAAHVFAAGDCASPIPVVHLAVIQGEVAAKNAERRIRNDHSESSSEWSRETAMNGLFTDPQCVEIGLTEMAARKNNIPIIAGRVDYFDQGKGMIAGSRHGFVKIIACAEKRVILGAVGIGPSVLESSHILQLAIVKEMTLEEYEAVPHYHPTLVEAWVSAAENAIDQHPIDRR